jgi:hypothetical protein
MSICFHCDGSVYEGPSKMVGCREFLHGFPRGKNFYPHYQYSLLLYYFTPGGEKHVWGRCAILNTDIQLELFLKMQTHMSNYLSNNST